MLRSFAPLLGCGVMMLVFAAVMAMAGRNRRSDTTVPASADEVAALREEIARVRRIDEQRRSTVADDPT